jgi:hypothetical protein
MKTRLFALYPEGFVHVLGPTMSKVCVFMTGGAALVQAEPLLVKTFPLVPGEVSPVPPCAGVTAVPDCKTVPFTFGKVSVVLEAAAPASSVTPPPPEPLIETGIRQCSKLIRQER